MDTADPARSAGGKSPVQSASPPRHSLDVAHAPLGAAPAAGALGLVRRSRPSGGGHWEYHLTEAGEACRPVIDLMAIWGRQWAVGRLSRESSTRALMMWVILRRARVRGQRPPEERVVIQFDISDAPKGRRYWWLVLTVPRSTCASGPWLRGRPHVAQQRPGAGGRPDGGDLDRGRPPNQRDRPGGLPAAAPGSSGLARVRIRAGLVGRTLDTHSVARFTAVRRRARVASVRCSSGPVLLSGWRAPRAAAARPRWDGECSGESRRGPRARRPWRGAPAGEERDPARAPATGDAPPGSGGPAGDTGGPAPGGRWRPRRRVTMHLAAERESAVQERRRPHTFPFRAGSPPSHRGS